MGPISPERPEGVAFWPRWSLQRWPADGAFDEPLPSPQAALYLRGLTASPGPITAVRLSVLDWQGQPVPLRALQELSVFSRE